MYIPESDPRSYDPQRSYAAKQLSRYDMQVAGIVVYVVTMTLFFVVALVFMLFGGTATQARMPKVMPTIAAGHDSQGGGLAKAEAQQARVQR